MLDRITSSMFHSCLKHQLVTHFVLPVSDFWQFGPWWIPKLGNQPTLGLHPKFSLLSSPLDRFDSCGVRQAIYFITRDNISFVLRTWIDAIRLGHANWLDGSFFQYGGESKIERKVRQFDM